MYTAWRRWKTKLKRLCTHTSLSYFVYRYRYLATFTLIGFLSIVLEIVLASSLMPADWPWVTKAVLAFLSGLVFSFLANAWLNFHVPASYLFDTFRRFATVSALSFLLNMFSMHYLQEWFGQAYALARLVSAGTFFSIAYLIHRRYTFDLSRNFGVAIYASKAEKVYQAFHRIGRNCDHVHVDLIDETMGKNVAPVDLDKIRLVRRFWPGMPICLHVMSLTPARWFEQTQNEVDWYLFHVNSVDDLWSLIARCRTLGKKVGVVWHMGAAFASLLPLLPHVDFVMVLGIAEPGRSGQQVTDEAVALAAVVDSLRSRYGYDVVFDGGVNMATIRRIRAKYVVAASAVLRSSNPIRSVHSLRTSAKYERLSA